MDTAMTPAEHFQHFVGDDRIKLLKDCLDSHLTDPKYKKLHVKPRLSDDSSSQVYIEDHLQHIDEIKECLDDIRAASFLTKPVAQKINLTIHHIISARSRTLTAYLQSGGLNTSITELTSEDIVWYCHYCNEIINNIINPMPTIVTPGSSVSVVM